MEMADQIVSERVGSAEELEWIAMAESLGEISRKARDLFIYVLEAR
jgi:hypothetical protein